MAFSQLVADYSPIVRSIQISEGALSKQRPKDNVEKNGGTLHMASPACDWGSQGGGDKSMPGSPKRTELKMVPTMDPGGLLKRVRKMVGN